MAARFWVGGTGTWDASTTTHWAATTGGAGGQTVPGSADTVSFDGSSGGGTVTVNATVTVQSITCGAFTGTLDFSANNNDVTLSAQVGFSGSGTGTRTINLGNGLWTLSATNANLTMTTTTGLSFNANSSTISFTGAASASQRAFNGGGLTYNAVSINGNTSGGGLQVNGSNIFSSLTVAAPNAIYIVNSTTQTIGTFTVSGGGSAAQIHFASNATNIQATISVVSGTVSLPWTAPRGMVFSGGATFTAINSFDLGFNSGITITPPSSAGGLLVNRGMSGGMSG